jgi:hypothetical protein
VNIDQLTPDICAVEIQVEEDLVALNVGICELMLRLIVPPNTESDNKILWYYRDALYGKVLPVTPNLLFADYASINLKVRLRQGSHS